MASLSWNDIGTRLYNAGIDRGVLYVDDIGVSWNGLVSVDETSSGSDNELLYIDGVQYLNSGNIEDFSATLSAYYSPKEFDQCEGLGQVHPGFFAAQQRRKPFGLCYRTKIGNDTEQSDYGYKLHLIYNALVAPVQKSYKTIGDVADPSLLKWDFTVKPVTVPGAVRSAHLIIDSRDAPPFALIELESILYGTSEVDPRLPTAEEIATMFEGTEEFTVTDLGGGSFHISGSSLEVVLLDEGVYQISASGVVDNGDGSYDISS